MLEISYPVDFETLVSLISGYFHYVERKEEEDPLRGIRNLTQAMSSPTLGGYSESKDVKMKEYVREGFKGSPAANLVYFLAHFGGAWNYLKEDDRQITLESLKHLYRCLYNPVGFDTHFDKPKSSKGEKYDKMISRLEEIKLTDELIFTVNFFHKLTGVYLIPRIPKIKSIRPDTDLFNDLDAFKPGFWCQLFWVLGQLY
jgi:hypothetical protein